MCRGLCPDARGLCLDVPAAYTGQALQLPIKQAFNSSGGYDHTVARQRAPRRPQQDITFSGGTTTLLRGNMVHAYSPKRSHISQGLGLHRCAAMCSAYPRAQRPGSYLLSILLLLPQSIWLYCEGGTL